MEDFAITMVSESNYNISGEISNIVSLYTFDNEHRKRSSEKAKSSKTENNKEAVFSSATEKKSDSNKLQPCLRTERPNL